jgi:hypothetical protein
VKAKRVKKLDPAAPLGANAARIVRVRLDELRSFAPAALEPEASEAQHDMRIAAKRLRYVLEVTGFCLGEPAKRARRAARELQDVLGEIHDCDVMLPRIAEELERLRDADAAAVRTDAAEAPDLDPALSASARHRTAYGGLELLAVHAQARRALLFDRFSAHWGRLDREGVWTALERAARARQDSSQTVAGAREASASGAGARVL